MRRINLNDELWQLYFAKNINGFILPLVLFCDEHSLEEQSILSVKNEG